MNLQIHCVCKTWNFVFLA